MTITERASAGVAMTREAKLRAAARRAALKGDLWFGRRAYSKSVGR
jgi:hypothetical protein